MEDQAYLIIEVHYSEDVPDTWILPDFLKSLHKTEEGESEIEDGVRMAKFASSITPDDAARLRSEWGLAHEDSEPNLGMLTEYGWLPGDRYNPHPMDWNAGGWTPVFFVSISIFDKEVN